MPKIRWNDLPLVLRDHLFDRLRERKISAEDLYRLKLWRESEPEAPDGPWYKDFGLVQDLWRTRVSKDVPPGRPTREGTEALRGSIAGVSTESGQLHLP